jgi:hypothetical protein
LKRAFTFLQTLLSVIYLLAHLNQKTQKQLLNIIFLIKLANQYLQLLVGSTTFSILKGTTIDLLHLGVMHRPLYKGGQAKTASPCVRVPTRIPPLFPNLVREGTSVLMELLPPI